MDFARDVAPLKVQFEERLVVESHVQLILGLVNQTGYPPGVST